MENRKKYIIPIVAVIIFNLAVLLYLNFTEGGEQLSSKILSEINENPYDPSDNRFTYVVRKILRILSQIVDKFI